MAVLLLLLISFLGAEFMMQVATDVLPSGYSVEFVLRDRRAHLKLMAKYYCSNKEKAVRYDTYGGTNKFFINAKDPQNAEIYYYFPTTNDTAANVTNCKYIASLPGAKSEIMDILSSMYGHGHFENITVNGSPAEKWNDGRSYIDFHVRDTTWNQLFDQTQDFRTIRREYETRNNEEHYDLGGTSFVVVYDNFQQKEPEKTVWSLPKNVKCQRADKDTAEIIIDYIRYTISQILIESQQFLFSTPTQHKRKKGLKRANKVSNSALPFPHTDEDIQLMARQLPKMFDWRNHGAVTSVKDQGMCGSCWAFGITGAMEGAYFLKSGILADMSEQALVDCGWIRDSQGLIEGCFGGDSGTAFDWIKNHGGLPFAADYGDYKAINGKCTLKHVHTHGAIKGHVHVKSSIDAVKVALTHYGPLCVSISTPDVFMTYRNGVIKNVSVPGQIDHSVLLVGYGSLDGEDYWLIKNSWGKSWGQLGYGLISTKNNTLHLLDEVYYPELI